MIHSRKTPRTICPKSRYARDCRSVLFAVAVAFVCAESSSPAYASDDVAAECELAARDAALNTGIPYSVLMAIALVETGRVSGGRLRPWPWAVNLEGKGIWFDTRKAAHAFASEHYLRGARSFDVGCFQINYRWHHQNFDSIDHMFDPKENARYASEFLKKLFFEFGNWDAAAGAYHSRQPEHAEPYAQRFAELRSQLLDGEDAQVGRVYLRTGTNPEPPDRVLDAAEAIHPRTNTFPLLRAGGEMALGSLVPLGAESALVSLIDSGGTGLFAR